MSSLRPWQADELRDHLKDPKRAIFAAPRLGKTRMAIEYLKAWRPSSCLITAPKTVCPFWIEEARSQGITVLDGFSGTIKDTVRLLRANAGATVVVNDDRLAAILKEMPKLAPGALIADESHRFKSVSSARGKAYRKLAKRARYVRILTGTPTPNNYANLWGQMMPFDEGDWFSSFQKFKNRYLICDQMFQSKILGYKNLPELEAKLKKWATVVKREDVFGGDQYQFVERKVFLPPKVMTLYRKLAREWIVELNGQTVNGTHGLTRFLRFQQITSGFVNTENGLQNVHTAKIDAVCEDLEEIIESGEKAVIFCRYTWEVETYEREVKERLKCKVVVIQGSTPTPKRQEAIDLVNTSKDPVVCIAQIQAASTGISLAGATHALFTSETFSYSEQVQAQDRIYSPGKNKCVTYYRVPNTIDMYIAKTLEMKKSLGESVQNQKLEDILLGEN
jgi:SWI/SNF-related matrix-associated actin-dependent regulator 1 of chromatin subfamily A